MNEKFFKKKSSINIGVLLIILLITFFILATAIGAVVVPVQDTIKIIIVKIFNINMGTIDKTKEAVIFNVRLPRVIVTVLVGAALSVSGAAIQSMFRNPMAAPGIIGISSGASFGAVIAIAIGATSRNLYFMPLFAVIGSLSATLIIFKLAAKDRKVPILTLILAGIAVSTFIRAVTSLILINLQEEQMREYIFWSMGSLSARRWEHVNLIFVPILIFCTVLIYHARDLNVLLLGEEEAQSVGLNPYKARKRIVFFTSIITAMAVCVSGQITFVGLIVPHIMRMIVGHDNKILLPTSALAGSLFLLVCDLIGRTIIAPVEINVGIITSLIGAPYFLYLLSKARKDDAF